MEQNIVDLKNIEISQRENLIFSSFDFSMKKGDFVYLIGKTGSGKSSFMKTLYADIPLFSGEGNVAGYDLRTLKDKQIPFLRRKIGIIFQDFKLLNDRSVYENLAFVLKATGWTSTKEIKEKTLNTLDMVGMKTKHYKMPFELSGGEQQRVAIARALLNDPELILADEPTGNLDPSTSLEITELLKKIHLSGKSIIMATHDYAIIMKYPHKTYRCKNGKILEVVQNLT
ncbi:MAG: ATP-binding cassette domain-containing protein [Flavobacteriaceae bacterium]|nr:ATP-binding cassette domain-containing protein [Flavobacteriaceae bacterium]